MRIGQVDRSTRRLWVAGLLVLGLVTPGRSGPAAEEKKPAMPPARKAARPNKPVAPSAPPEALLTSGAWKDVPSNPLEAGEIDRLLGKEFEAGNLLPSPTTTDEQFLRRVHLDLTGQLPDDDEIERFLDDPDPDKRARTIGTLLDGDDYARHWARSWRGAIEGTEAPFGDSVAADFEEWLSVQIKDNRRWGEVVRDMITAEGSLKKGEKGKNGAVFLLGRYNGPDANIIRTAETARLFLGIQIQCAQCHNDRRTGLWKQVQFHEMAGFFARMTSGGSSGQFIKLGSKANGEHEMPDRQDPKLSYVTYPKFLDGKTPGENAGDQERRRALADFLTAPDNYWFSAAYVNRVWNELLGQPFYERVDDLSPKGAVVFPAVASRLAAAFRGSGYDTKALIRAIVESQAYQRQVRLGDASSPHLRFAAVYPTRLRAEVLWQALAGVLGPMPTDQKSLPMFRAEFDFDPSSRPDEVTGSITQALWLLNSAVVNDRIKVQDLRIAPSRQGQGPKNTAPEKAGPTPTLLKRLLAEYGNDDPAVVKSLYLHTLARRPTSRELQTCLEYLQEVGQGQGTDLGSRNEAFEDLLKALINSTEFQRKR
jgi:hypothetical protein